MGIPGSEARNLDHGVFVARLDLLAGSFGAAIGVFLPPMSFTKLNLRYEIKYSS
jgi:hypothetical protein